MFEDVTVIVPVALTLPQPPVNGILYGNVPEALGVPLIVIVLDDHDAVTPLGNPVADPIPVAPVVVCVIAVIGVLIHTVGVEEATPAVFEDVTETVVPADVDEHPPLTTVTL